MLRAAIAVTFAAISLVGCAGTPMKPDPESGPFRIGTGISTGVYHVLGQAICKRYRATVSVIESDCSARAGGSSFANMYALNSREFSFAIAHSHWVQVARSGLGYFTSLGWTQDLRAVTSFYPQTLNILVKRRSGIADLDDLKTARIAWVPRSAAGNLFRVLWAGKGWKEEEFKSLMEVKDTRAALKAFCNDLVDAMLSGAGHPSNILRQATADCDGTFLQIAGEGIKQRVFGRGWLSLAEIPAGTYEGQTEAISTFGSRPILITRADVPDALVRTITESILHDLPTFKKLHPAFMHLTPNDMMFGATTLPLHPGAEAYYQEIGLLP